VVPESRGGVIHGYNPQKDVTIRHGGKDFSHTGKVGTHNKTGEKAKEYRTINDERVWVRESGKVDED
jgi:hypothetical protein